MKEHVNSSPFVQSEFLNLFTQNISSNSVVINDHLELNGGVVTQLGDRNLIDYRPTPFISNKDVEKFNISKLQFDSLSYFQVVEIEKLVNYQSFKVTKSDVGVFLLLPDNYEDYVNNLSKKKRHELRRKKRIFQDENLDGTLVESSSVESFKIFIDQHKLSQGEKGDFMNQEMENYFAQLLSLKGWKLYTLNSSIGVLSSAFVYESQQGCYLYNSSKNPKFDKLNPGIVLVDLIIQQLITKQIFYFDFLKGTERYKYDFGGTSHQLYDVEII